MTLQPYIKPFVVAATLLSLFLCVCGILVTVPEALRGHIDFRQLYTAGYMVRSGHGSELHDFDAAEKFQNAVVGPAEGSLPFNHLAYESLLYAPFSLLPYRAAYVAFFAFNLAILAVAFFTLKPYLEGLREVWSFLPAATFLCFLPVTLALTEGQDSIILLALMICATRAFDRGDDLEAGAFVALTLFKFQYGVPIALLFLVWRRWRFLAGFALTAAAVTGISLWLTGGQGFIAYLHSLTEMSSRFSPAFGARYGIHPDLMPNLRGFVQAIAHSSTSTTNIVIAVSSALVLIWAATRRAFFAPRAPRRDPSELPPLDHRYDDDDPSRWISSGGGQISGLGEAHTARRLSGGGTPRARTSVTGGRTLLSAGSPHARPSPSVGWHLSVTSTGEMSCPSG